jgi:uncharacterized protein YccT (UPF0319 family)
MTCKDRGHAISMKQICEKPIQAATDMLKHMAAHNASHAFAAVEKAMQTELDIVPSDKLSPTLSASQQQEIASGSQLPN